MDIQEEISAWFLENRRPFPWRENPTPYAVLVSEMMLQQTQASVVLPYYVRWVERFPSLEELAQAPLSEVIKLWEGLGYYSRARRLHAAAQLIVKEYGGKIPKERAALEKIPGLGPYTVGALLTFGFHEREPAVDGNVLRVAARLLLIKEEIERPQVRDQISAWVREQLSGEAPWVTMEALIELGATLCMKKPLCSRCPVRRHCRAYREGMVDELPKRRPRPKTTLLEKEAFLIFSGEELLVRRVPPGEIMADLYEFPTVKPKGHFEELPQELPPVTHTFTRYRATLHPKLLRLSERLTVEGHEWHPLETLLKLPFSSGHRKLLHELCGRLK